MHSAHPFLLMQIQIEKGLSASLKTHQRIRKTFLLLKVIWIFFYMYCLLLYMRSQSVRILLPQCCRYLAFKILFASWLFMCRKFPVYCMSIRNLVFIQDYVLVSLVYSIIGFVVIGCYTYIFISLGWCMCVVRFMFFRLCCIIMLCMFEVWCCRFSKYIM